MAGLFVPHLDQKLACLFQRHPTIKSQQALAAALQLSPSNITAWIRGDADRGRPTNTVPNRHVYELCERLNIPAEILESKSIDEFKQFIERKDITQSNANTWAEMEQRSQRSSAIEILPAERGLVLDGPEDPEMPRYTQEQRLIVEIDLEMAQREANVTQLTYGMIFATDVAAIYTLFPNSRMTRGPRLDGARIRIPDPEVTAYPLRFRGINGRQILHALLTRRPLPEDLYAELQAPQPRQFLDRIARIVTPMGSDGWCLLRREFLIV